MNTATTKPTGSSSEINNTDNTISTILFMIPAGGQLAAFVEIPQS
jgi:hypothetical protein